MIEAARQVGANGEAHQQPPPLPSYRFSVLDSKDFFAADYRMEWYVRNLLVAGQPAVIGGPRKSLKTSALVDLAVSLASATPFLGSFAVYKPLSVVLLSSESGEAVLQETARRVCAARRLDTVLLSGRLFWGFDLPQLASPLDLAELKAGLQRLGVQVALFDPLYLALLAGQPDLEASNMFHMGPVLRQAAKACLDVRCLPVFVHHTKKNLQHPYEPLEMEDLAYAGVQEFARQWLLINRRQVYEPGSGSHRLWVVAGGSAGQGGCWSVNIEEGQLNDDFTGRTWQVEVEQASDARAEMAQAKDSQAEQKKSQKVKDDGVKLLRVLDSLADKKDGWAGRTKVRDLAHLSGPQMTRTVAALVGEGVIEEGTTESASGKNRKVKKRVEAIRRVRVATDGTDGTDAKKRRRPSTE